MKKLLFLLCFPLNIFCQNTIGLPDVVNYTKQSYSAGLQNWDIKQDKNGIIYVANNEGLLSFDGKKWKLYELPNKTIVGSVEIGNDGKIYVGGQDELGYFSPSQNGQLQYHSLTPGIPLKDRSFGDVWDIVSVDKNIFFRTTNKIFKFTNESAATFTAPSEWAYLGVNNGKLYAQDFKMGLMVFENDVWSPLFSKNELPLIDPVTAILPINKDSALITTLKHGLFTLSKSGISKLPSVNTRLFENNRIYAATQINKEWIALATSNDGVYITDVNGNFIQSFSEVEGLQNNNVLSIFLDNQSNLWLGLNNGIDLISYNTALKKINPLPKNASGYTAIISGNQFYAGTSSGLFSFSLSPAKDLSYCKGKFFPVKNTEGQVWGLANINNQLLMGHHEGAFEIKDNNAVLISSITGFWNFLPLTGTFPTPTIVAGNYKGLSFFDFNNNQFTMAGTVAGFDESSRFVTMDKYDNIWVSHPYHGVFKIRKNSNNVYASTPYTSKNGLPALLNNHVFKIKNEMVVATEKGIYNYNQQKNYFEPDSLYKKLLDTLSVRYLKEDKSGNIWFIHEKELGVIDLSEKKPSVIYLQELNNKLLSGFEFIYPVDENNIFLGGEKGFYHLNYDKYKATIPKPVVQIRQVIIINKKDSLLFGGYFNEVNEKQTQSTDIAPEINHDWKTIHFEFSSPLFGNQANLEYSYRLNGFENWSAWSGRTEKEYTNLPAGKFDFEVRVKNNLGEISPVSSYSFKMLPPWYQSIWANILYLLIFLSLLYFIIRWQKKKFKHQQVKHLEEQKKLSYIHELEINKSELDLLALNNEKLEAEINFNNSKMASSAMHLVKKGALLSKIKTQLTQVMKRFDDAEVAGELKRMIKTLSEDENIDEEWDSFTKHFDKVHSDFLNELKEKHSDITPNELKLCAYLRMNLSTKEIAQVMNISVRGVDISRYRLRKKLQIPTEVSLFDYLISVKAKT